MIKQPILFLLKLVSFAVLSVLFLASVALLISIVAVFIPILFLFTSGAIICACFYLSYLLIFD